MMSYQQVCECAEFLRNALKIEDCRIGFILGSGQGALADALERPRRIAYKEIPHFPLSTVPGHRGELVVGTLEGKGVIVMSGRFHYYEGYTPAQVGFPVRVFRALGVEELILTNASGGITPGYNPGDLVLLSDHLNLTGTNPLIGENLAEQGERFPDMSTVYDQRLRQRAHQAAAARGITLKEGVYAAVAGPSYETPAEIRMIAGHGADLIGMSTVFESITARHCGLKTLAVACVTNRAAGAGGNDPLSHDEVIRVGRETAETVVGLLRALLRGAV